MIIWDCIKSEILLLGDNVYRLPHFARCECSLWSDASIVNSGIHDLFGMDFITLRCLRLEPQEQSGEMHFFYAGVPRNLNWQPPSNSRWIHETDIDDIDLEVSLHWVILREWFSWLADTTHRHIRVPWFEAGWFHSAESWFIDQLSDMGFRANSPVEQLRSCQRSSILRVKTDQARVYMKAIPLVFAHEPVVSSLLAMQYPDNITPILAYDPVHHWFLMPDLGVEDLSASPDIEKWSEAMNLYARIQISTMDRVDELLSIGCPDRRPDIVSTQMTALLADSSAMQPDDSLCSFTDDEVIKINELVPELSRMCSRLYDYNVPFTIEHGDLWAGQVMVQGDNIIFTDWSDCSISHPFFSLYKYLLNEKMEQNMPNEHGVLERLMEAYLEPWTEFEPMNRLLELFQISGRIAGLHFALMYYQRILPGMEIKWENHRMLPYHLREAIS